MPGLKFLVVPKAKVEHLKFLPIEPDYEIGPKACTARATIVEKDREGRAWKFQAKSKN